LFFDSPCSIANGKPFQKQCLKCGMKVQNQRDYNKFCAVGSFLLPHPVLYYCTLNVLTHILSECHGKRYYSDHVAVVQQNVSHVVIETIFGLMLEEIRWNFSNFTR